MLTKAKLAEGGRKRWEGVSAAERSRVMKRARVGQAFRAKKKRARKLKRDNGIKAA